MITSRTWGELYDESFPIVYRALVAVLFDPDAAADAIHDAFVEGLHNPPSNTGNLVGWIYRVALRKARRSRARDARAVRLIGSHSLADSQMTATLDQLTIGRLLMLLTERQRVIVVAHYFLGLTQQEIADQLGIRRGTVGSTIAHSLARMRLGGLHAI